MLLVLTLFLLQTPLCSPFLQFESALLLQPLSGSMLRGVLDRHLEGLRSGLECPCVARELLRSVAYSSSAVELVAVRVLLVLTSFIWKLRASGCGVRARAGASGRCSPGRSRVDRPRGTSAGRRHPRPDTLSHCHEMCSTRRWWPHRFYRSSGRDSLETANFEFNQDGLITEAEFDSKVLASSRTGSSPKFEAALRRLHH